MPRKSYPRHLRELEDRASAGYLAGMFPKAPAGEGEVIEGLRSAHRRIVAAWVASWRYHGQVTKDPTKTVEGREVQSARYTRTQLAQARKAYDAALGEAAETYERLIARMTDKLGHHPLDREIRDHLRGLDGAERMRLMAEPAVRRAVATGPAFLSGVTEETHARAKDAYLAEVAPGAHAMAGQVAAAIEATTGAWAALSDHCDATHDWSQIEAWEQTGTLPASEAEQVDAAADHGMLAGKAA